MGKKINYGNENINDKNRRFLAGRQTAHFSTRANKIF